MPDTGTQQPLPFPRRSALHESPDAAFPLAAERLLLRQRIESLQHLLDYQGTSLNALRVIIAIKDDQIRHLGGYIKALEREVRQHAEP